MYNVSRVTGIDLCFVYAAFLETTIQIALNVNFLIKSPCSTKNLISPVTVKS